MFPNYPGGHGAYQDFVVRGPRDHYAGPTQLPSGLLDIVERFWQKDLTGVNTIMREVYSPFGPRPRSACCMLRSYLLSIELHFSVTKWVDQMRRVNTFFNGAVVCVWFFIPFFPLIAILLLLPPNLLLALEPDKSERLYYTVIVNITGRWDRLNFTVPVTCGVSCSPERGDFRHSRYTSLWKAWFSRRRSCWRWTDPDPLG